MAKTGRIRIILDIFSGRPNPEWELSEGDTKILKEKLIDLPVAKSQNYNILGYRGIIIHNPDRVMDLPENLRIFNGTIIRRVDKESVYHEDKNNIEEWILSQEKAQEFKEVINDSRVKQ